MAMPGGSVQVRSGKHIVFSSFLLYDCVQRVGRAIHPVSGTVVTLATQ